MHKKYVTKFNIHLQEILNAGIEGTSFNMLAPWKKSYDKPRQHIKKQRRYFVNKGLQSQSYCFSSSHVWMWELDHKESWVPKNWWFRTVVLEKALENPLDCKEIKAVNPKGNQPWIFIGRTDARDETLLLWPPDVKSRLTGKDPDAGKDWEQEEKEVTENKMVGWHHSFNGHEFEQTQRQWRIRKPGILQSMAFARVKCNLATEQWL